jgi:xanthine dehydrogenase accessory factor
MPEAPVRRSRTDLRSVCARLLGALRMRQEPALAPGEIPCFSPSALRGEPWGKADLPGAVLASLTEEDIPTLERAIQAIDSGERAWLGFKIVTDAAAAVGGNGSADGRHGVFLVVDAPGDRANAQLIFGRPCSERDRRQMLDITRGPQMHGEQYAGLAWKSVPLLKQTRVFIMGAGTVSAEVERIANLADFATLVVDFDPAYLNAARFPLSERILIDSFDAIPDLGIGPDDFVCVLTRGHMHDPQALVHGVRAGAGYVGMMGSARKNQRVFDLAEQSGIERSALEATHTPIGLKFGARSPVELAISVVAELIQVRRDRHGPSRHTT